MLTLDPHPLLDTRAFITSWSTPLRDVSSKQLAPWFDLSAKAPLAPPDDALRAAIRDLLRHGGYKPTGRGKPSSEYLVRAAGEGALKPINAAVDVCNVVSLHSGLPISVIDLARAAGPLRVGVAAEGTTYVFNASGQTIDVSGLLCLYDVDGPIANAVKDSQRTKTTPDTTRTLSILWGSQAVSGRVGQTVDWYRALVHSLGATTESVTP